MERGLFKIKNIVGIVIANEAKQSPNEEKKWNADYRGLFMINYYLLFDCLRQL